MDKLSLLLTNYYVAGTGARMQEFSELRAKGEAVLLHSSFASVKEI